MPPASAGEIVPPAAVAEGLDVSRDVGVEVCDVVGEEVDGVPVFVEEAGVAGDVTGIGTVSVAVDVTGEAAAKVGYMVVVYVVICCSVVSALDLITSSASPLKSRLSGALESPLTEVWAPEPSAPVAAALPLRGSATGPRGTKAIIAETSTIVDDTLVNHQ